MKPDLEVVQIGRAESFKAWEHGYPFRTVRWHFHPELELHYVVSTSGRYFVGDFIGSFETGNLVMTGPNLPHNWVSDTLPSEEVWVRSRVVQFTESFVTEAATLMPEVACFRDTMERSRRGPLFGAETAARVGPTLEELVQAKGIRRIELFWRAAGALARAQDRQELTSPGYLPDPPGFMSARINQVLAYINDNLTEPFSETDLARIAGLSTGALLMMNDEALRLTGEVDPEPVDELHNREPSVAAEAAGVNRQFLRHKGMTPSRFRAFLGDNIASGAAARVEAGYAGAAG